VRKTRRPPLVGGLRVYFLLAVRGAGVVPGAASPEEWGPTVPLPGGKPKHASKEKATGKATFILLTVSSPAEWESPLARVVRVALTCARYFHPPTRARQDALCTSANTASSFAFHEQIWKWFEMAGGGERAP
jgi:hypothetical protein